MLPKGCPIASSGGQRHGQATDLGGREPEVAHEGPVQCRRVGIGAERAGLKCPHLVDQAGNQIIRPWRRSIGGWMPRRSAYVIQVSAQ